MERNKGYILHIVLIVVLGFGVYANSLSGKFIWDDQALVRDNVFIRNPSNISKVFTKDIASGAGLKCAFYRPLQMLTFLADYSFWKLDVRGYHLTNTIFHVLAALALFWFVNIVFGKPNLAFLTSALFVVHPVHTEAVAYIAGRADSMALLFMLLALIFYAKNGIFFYILALLSKETAMILPVLMLLHDKRRARALPYFIITGVYITLRATLLSPLLSNVSHSTTLFQRVPGFFVAMTNYIKLLFFPFNLHMEYGNKVFPFTDPLAITGAALTLGLLAYAFAKRKSGKLVFFSIMWFFITLLPSANLYPINAYMAEHWLYIPSIGFFLIVANSILSFPRKRESRSWIPIFMGMTLIIYFATLTIMQNNYWRDPVTFYKRTLEYSPRNPRLLNWLGIAYDGVGKREKAIFSYEEAARIDPGYPEPYNNLGNIYVNTGRAGEAVALFKKVIELNPYHASAHNNLGNTYNELERREEAITHYKKALELNPYYGAAYNNLGATYYNMGRYVEAMVNYKKAIELNPHHPGMRRNLELVYKKLEELKKTK